LTKTGKERTRLIPTTKSAIIAAFQKRKRPSVGDAPISSRFTAPIKNDADVFCGFVPQAEVNFGTLLRLDEMGQKRFNFQFAFSDELKVYLGVALVTVLVKVSVSFYGQQIFAGFLDGITPLVSTLEGNAAVT